MRPCRILIADQDAESALTLKNFLSSKDDTLLIECVNDGGDALMALGSSSINILITDILLPSIDGLSLIERIQPLLYTSSLFGVIVISTIASENALSHACSLGVNFCFLKPADPSSVYSRITEIINSNSSLSIKDEPLDIAISSILLTAGITPNVQGFHFIREAVKLKFLAPTKYLKLTRDIYPKVAEIFSSSPSRVERAIRHAIDMAWNRGRASFFNRIFGVEVYSRHERPTSGEFIAIIADRLILERWKLDSKKSDDDSSDKDKKQNNTQENK